MIAYQCVKVKEALAVDIQVGDVLQMKKTHPAGGGNGWFCGLAWFSPPVPDLRTGNDDFTWEGGKKCEKNLAQSGWGGVK